MRWKASLLATVALLSLGASLPKTGPVPERRPEAMITAPANDDQPSGANPEVAAPPPAQSVPTPEAKPVTRPDAGDATKDRNQQDADTPADGTKDATPPAGKEQDEKAQSNPTLPEPPLTIEPEDDATLKACLADLTAIGASVQTIDRVDDENGCGMDKPVRVDRLLPGVALSPAAEFRCETALQLALFVREQVIPAARIGLPGKAKLTSVNHASAYVCRKRNGASTGKISEHARGNAVDIGSLSFGSETVPMRIVKPEDLTIEDAFQRSINATACLYFSTVLSPGSDAAHQDHMHLDVLERNGGYRYCR